MARHPSDIWLVRENAAMPLWTAIALIRPQPACSKQGDAASCGKHNAFVNAEGKMAGQTDLVV